MKILCPLYARGPWCGAPNKKCKIGDNMKKTYIFALGFFDGVHLGHQVLLEECCHLARQMGAGTAAITFDSHPQSLFSENIPPLINNLPDREALLRQFGVQYIHVFPVTREVMSTPWQDFLQELLTEGAVGFVCGDDFHFGFRGEGNAQALAAFCRERGLPCTIVTEQAVDGIRVSSTYIRSQIESGDMETAVRFLGHPHILTGEVIPGKQLGRKLGIPTANLRLPEKTAVPKFGVYACRALVNGVYYPAVTNVGIRPTVSGAGITVEPWILDYSGDLYGQRIRLEFYYFIRPEKKFDSLDALKSAIHADAQEAREVFSRGL